MALVEEQPARGSRAATGQAGAQGCAPAGTPCGPAPARDLRAALEAERAPDVGHCRLEGVEPLGEAEYIARFEQTPQ